MLAYLKGNVAAVRDGSAVIEVNGIAFLVYISSRDASDMPPVGSNVKIFTFLSVGGDTIRLYGFLSEDDLNIYKKMIAVSGIGPKAALGILGTLSASSIRLAIISDDEKSIARAPGVGSKTARKLILDLKDKLKLDEISGAPFTEEGAIEGSMIGMPESGTKAGDAVQALVALGYSNSESLKAVRKVKATNDMETQDIIKHALRYIGL